MPWALAENSFPPLLCNPEIWTPSPKLPDCTSLLSGKHGVGQLSFQSGIRIRGDRYGIETGGGIPLPQSHSQCHNLEGNAKRKLTETPLVVVAA